MVGPGCRSGCDAGEGSGRLSQTGERRGWVFVLFLLMLADCVCEEWTREDGDGSRWAEIEASRGPSEVRTAELVRPGSGIWSSDLESWQVFLDGPGQTDGLVRIEDDLESWSFCGFMWQKRRILVESSVRGASLVLSPAIGRPPMSTPTAPPSSHYGFRRPLPVGSPWTEPLCRFLLPCIQQRLTASRRGPPWPLFPLSPTNHGPFQPSRSTRPALPRRRPAPRKRCEARPREADLD